MYILVAFDGHHHVSYLRLQLTCVYLPGVRIIRVCYVVSLNTSEPFSVSHCHVPQCYIIQVDIATMPDDSVL